MGVKRTLEDCKYLDSDICHYAGSEGCESCYVGENLNNPAFDNIMERWTETLSLIPENIDEVHLSDHCLFCKGEVKNPTDCYALADLANRKPEYKKGIILGYGKKVVSNIGSLLPVPVACCSRCRNSIRTYSMLKWLTGVLGIILGFLVLLITPVLDALRGVHDVFPYIVAALLIVAGFVAGRFISAAYKKTVVKETEFDIFNLPVLSDMKEGGWFAMQYEDGLPRLTFKKTKPRPHFMIRREKSY